MKTRYILFSILLLAVFALSSCQKEDESSSRFLAYATISDAANHVLMTDIDAERLYVEENSNIVGEWVDGRRVIVDYTVLRQHENASILKSYYVKVNSTYSILTKNPVKKSFLSSPVREDSIGHDPINIHDVWFAGNYMNINFALWRDDPGVTHFINLVIDDSKTTSDDVYAELRHNAFADAKLISAWGNVSFKVSDYLVSPKSSFKIHLSRQTYSGEFKTDTITYNSGLSLMKPVVLSRSLVQ
ncbi:MAG: NigD-like C-terminal domain-containing protein [Bacteroidales bacterium]|nr:NigD-like C-terminal domain-containing protein [Bacteroidales bacterium]